MELRKLSDVELENQLVSFVEKERSLLCVIILHVMEIERRKKYLNCHPNLFRYLCDLLKYSHGSAQRRIDAAMLALEVPEVLPLVKSGELNASQITSAQVAFRLAAKNLKTKVPKELKLKVLNEIKNKTVSESEVIIYSLLNIKPKAKTNMKYQADGSVAIETVLTKEQFAKLERMKELLSHSVPSGKLPDLLEYLSDRVIAQKDKAFPPARMNTNSKSDAIPSGKASASVKVTAEIPDGKISESATAAGRDSNPKAEVIVKHSGRFLRPAQRKSIKISIQREVFARDKCCQHTDPVSGKVCGSQWHLQMDHIQPVWAGGADEASNLRVYCGQHNRYAYRRQVGLR